MKKKFVIIILFLIVCAGWYGLHEYYRTNAQTSDLKPDIKISAIDLYNSFTTDETHADSVYLNKLIQITGKVTEIKKDSAKVSLLIDGGNGMFGVNCLLQNRSDGEEMGKIKKDTKITIKGICNGMNMDVSLTRCVIVPTDKK